MLQSNERIVKHKIGLLNLAEELSNVSKAFKIMGLFRYTFYRYNGCSKYRKARIITHHVEFIFIFFSPTASFCWLHGHHGVAKRLAG